jgi:cell division protein FtsL
MLALASFFVLGLLLVTWQANELALVQMGIKRSKRQIRQEIIKNNELRAKLDEKMAFERIEKIARDKWRLKLLTEGTGKRIIYLELPRSSPRQ